jgi:eukaryotic translation initiation factor 2C
MPPNLLFFIVNDRNIDVYRRIKKSCDIRFGVASQVLQAKHVMSASPQYISNVCMKVNAKLGGCTSVAKSQVIPKCAPKSASSKFFRILDVIHPLTLHSSHHGRWC